MVLFCNTIVAAIMKSTAEKNGLIVIAAACAMTVMYRHVPRRCGAEEISRVTPVVKACRKARPAVVNISSTKMVRSTWGGFGRSMFDDIFPELRPRQREVNSLGSGFIISPHGYAVTNAHVVRRARDITVKFADGTRYGADVVVADASSDLAVIRLDRPLGKKPGVSRESSFPSLRLGCSDDLMVGETVIAVGNPLGFSNSVTTGVVSAVNRKLTFGNGVEYGNLIQIDAPINPGNSGGPLLNIRGEPIGINTAIRADAQNIGFAVDIDTLAKQLPVMLDIERLARVDFGLDVDTERRNGKTVVYVSTIREGSPAHRANLRVGDLVTEINGAAVEQVCDYVFEILETKIPGTVRLGCVRGERAFSAVVGITEKSAPNGAALAESMMGLQLRDMSPRLARSLRLPTDRGLLVVGVEEGSPAARLGLRLKDILFEVGGVYVNTLDDIGLVLEKQRGGGVIRIGVLRGNTAAAVPLKLRDRSAGRPKKSGA